MAIYSVKTSFIFAGTFFVRAESTAEAKKLVEESCGLAPGGSPHVSLQPRL
jgi:hypothetical protein